MPVNPAEQSMESRLIDRIISLENQVLDLRSKQRVGADSIAITFNNGYVFGPVTIPAGGYSFFNLTTTPNVPLLTIWNFEFTVYVDSNGLDGFQYPGGSSLSGGREKMRMSVWSDWYNSNDSKGVRCNKVVIENYDTATHDYYLRFGIIVPKLPIN